MPEKIAAYFGVVANLTWQLSQGMFLASNIQELARCQV